MKTKVVKASAEQRQFLLDFVDLVSKMAAVENELSNTEIQILAAAVGGVLSALPRHGDKFVDEMFWSSLTANRELFRDQMNTAKGLPQ